MAGGCGRTYRVDPRLDPAACNALTRDADGRLLVPSTDYVGLAPGGAVGTARSVDVDITETGGCPRTVTVGARLTPFAAVAFQSAPIFDLAPLARGVWHDVPGVSLVLPEAGLYALDGVMFAAIQANPPAHFLLFGRIADAAGNEVLGGRMLGAAFTWYFDGPAGPDYGGDAVVSHQGHASPLIGVGGPTTVKMQAQFVRREPPPSGSVDPIFAWVINSGDGVTSLRAHKISD